MKALTTYTVIKNNTVIGTGISPTFYVHGMIYSIIDKQEADSVIVKFENGKTITVSSPQMLFRKKPNPISKEEHQRWFSGCRYKLDV